MKKEQILKVLKKYGFYSLNRAPYLYEKNGEVGVYFVWPNIHYGILERVLFFTDEQSLEEEVYKYWWFLNNKKKLAIEVLFDNYESLSPQITYRYKNTILTIDQMKDFDQKNMIIDHDAIVKKKQLLRTANILIMILREKFKLQNETYFKVVELQDTLKQLTNAFYKKLNQYNKSDEEVSETYELLIDDTDESENLTNTLYSELSLLNSVEEIRNFIKTLFGYLQNIDMSEIHLQNVYLLNRYPFEIDDMRKKIDILDNALAIKKKIFKSKQNVLELLKEIDLNSQCKKMININIYIDQEKQRIQEKYENCNQIEENILGDYLLEFEKMNIEVPDLIESSNYTMPLTKENVLHSLKLSYEKLNKKEKSACHIAASFLGECLNDLSEISFDTEYSISDVISQLVLKKKSDYFNEVFHLLDHYLNAKIRVKYFSILKIDSFEHFIESLLNTLHILHQINIKLDSTFIGYFNNMEKEIIPLHLKNYSYIEQSKSYIAYVEPNVSIFYSPIQIVKPLDIIENEELVLRENEIVFLLKEKISIETKEEKIAVKKYEKDGIEKKKNFVVVTNMKEKNKCIYYENRITAKESE